MCEEGKESWVGWRPRDDEAKKKSSLEKSQKEIEDAAKEIAHKTKLERDQDARRVPTKIVALEEAAAGSSRSVERRVLRKQARRARAEYLVKCSSLRKFARQLLKEPYIDGFFSLKTGMSGKKERGDALQ